VNALGYGLVQVMGYHRGLTKPLKNTSFACPPSIHQESSTNGSNWDTQLIDVIMAGSMTQECSIDHIVAKEKESSWKMRETIGTRNNQLLELASYSETQ
jgi:hypothetical protein